MAPFFIPQFTLPRAPRTAKITLLQGAEWPIASPHRRFAYCLGSALPDSARKAA
jgi:hypothetical protein